MQVIKKERLLPDISFSGMDNNYSIDFDNISLHPVKENI